MACGSVSSDRVACGSVSSDRVACGRVDNVVVACVVEGYNQAAFFQRLCWNICGEALITLNFVL